jgi:hypothetical protein
MADERVEATESEEEARERVAQVRATQIFGDTPTDPTIGDVVVPAHDEEAANAASAAVAAEVEDGNEEAAELSPEEAKRQLEPLDADDVQDGAESESDAGDDGAVAAGDTDSAPDSEDESSDEGNVTAAEKVERIKSASSVEEVDSIAADDDRKTVQDAADKKRDELS